MRKKKEEENCFLSLFSLFLSFVCLHYLCWGFLFGISSSLVGLFLFLFFFKQFWLGYKALMKAFRANMLIFFFFFFCFHGDPERPDNVTEAPANRTGGKHCRLFFFSSPPLLFTLCSLRFLLNSPSPSHLFMVLQFSFFPPVSLSSPSAPFLFFCPPLFSPLWFRPSPFCPPPFFLCCRLRVKSCW